MSDRRRSLPLTVAAAGRRRWMTTFGPRTLGVRGLVTDGDGRFLLVRHTYGRPSWYLPGGGVRRRERLVDALLREMREEVGVEVPGGARSLVVFSAYSDLAQGRSDHVTVFVVGEWRRRSADNREIDRCQFFAPDDLPSQTSPGTRRRIEEYLGRKPVGHDW